MSSRCVCGGGSVSRMQQQVMSTCTHTHTHTHAARTCLHTRCRHLRTGRTNHGDSHACRILPNAACIECNLPMTRSSLGSDSVLACRVSTSKQSCKVIQSRALLMCNEPCTGVLICIHCHCVDLLTHVPSNRYLFARRLGDTGQEGCRTILF
jgi:hypothetical protein